VSGGGLSLVGRRNTKFSGLLSMPGGASFELPSSVNPPGSEVITILLGNESEDIPEQYTS
jgi:hypothetical protein